MEALYSIAADEHISVAVTFLACWFERFGICYLGYFIVSSLASMLNSTSTILPWIFTEIINKMQLIERQLM
jgi:hypothetical protein